MSLIPPGGSVGTPVVPIRFELETVEAGRVVVRVVSLDVAAGAMPSRLRMTAGGLVLLSVPLQLWDHGAGEDEDEDDV